MLKKAITYDDFDGVTRTEDFYFNLTKAELAEMSLRAGGGFVAELEAIGKSADIPKMFDTFKWVILSSYGQRSDDGKSFSKSDELSAAFRGSEAFSVLMMEIMTDATKAVEFITSVVPKDLSDKVRESMKDELPKELIKSETVEDTRPAYIRENREPTKKELNNMSQEELKAAFLNLTKNS